MDFSGSRLGAAAAAFVLLAACSSNVGPVGTETPAEVATTVDPNRGCTVIQMSPTQSAEGVLPSVSPSDFAVGSVDAAATLILYCDLQSPQCEVFNAVLYDLMENYGTELRVVHRLFPVPASSVPALDKSELSARFAIAAGNQGKFWEVRSLLHARHAEWSGLSPDAFKAWFLELAPDLGIEMEQLQSDIENPETEARARSAFESATALGISSIPTVFINGRLQQRPAMSYSGLNSTIGLIVLAQKQYSQCPPFEIDPSLHYEATIHTEKGDIVIQLLPERAPLAVNSFVFLARQGWYDGTTFHRVLPGYIAQAGDPSGTGLGSPGYYYMNEVYTDLGFDAPGVVGMANSGPDTNGSQFFITYAPEPRLDGLYTIFGQVIDGMKVVESLTPRNADVTPGLPAGDKIISIEVQTR